MLAALLLLAPPAHAQQDAWWLFGIPPDDSYAFDFRQEEMVFQPMEHGGVVRNGPTISSPDGELLFYSNGHGVLNRNHKFMHNAQGDSLLAPAWANEGGGGASILPEHTLILPMPGRDSMFYVIYFDGPSQPRHRASTLKYTVVNLKLNNGLGGLEQMNTVLATQDTFIGVHLEAIRHANGRDWWVPVYRPATGRKGFYRFLVQKDTITGAFQEVKNINDHPWIQRTTYPLCASPDGSLLGIAFHSNRLVILDFDRCTGAISIRHTAQPVPVAKPELDNGSQLLGCSFSPNNRYFYLSRTNAKYPWTPGEDTLKGVLAQYDLHLAPDSMDTTTETIIYASDSVDYGVMASGRQIMFFNHQFGPDGKIYISSGPSSRFVHVINSPDSAGKKCNLDFAKYFMDVNNGVTATYIPVNFPNFRLGAVPTYRARAGPDTVIKEGGAARLGSPGVEGLVYSWSPAAGLDKPGHPQPVAAPDATTTYYLTVTDTNPSPKHSCTVRTDSVTVTVEHPPEPPPEPIRIPTLLLPEQHKPVFRIHGLPEQSRLRVYNALGQEVYASEHYQNDWNISRLAAAMYFYVLEMPPDKVPEGEAHVRRGKLVVVR